MKNGELDLGLIEGLPHVSSLHATPWKHDELVIVVGKDHQWANTKRASVKMLKQAAWIIREKGSGTREIFEAAMSIKNISFTTALELGHTEAIKKATEAGLGVGCLSRMAVQRELENGWLVEIASPLDLQRTLIILTRNNEHRTKLLEEFIAQLKENQDCLIRN